MKRKFRQRLSVVLTLFMVVLQPPMCLQASGEEPDAGSEEYIGGIEESAVEFKEKDKEKEEEESKATEELETEMPSADGDGQEMDEENLDEEETPEDAEELEIEMPPADGDGKEMDVQAAAGTLFENFRRESGSDRVYADLEFNDSQNWGLSYNRKNNNQITWEQAPETGGGCIALSKCSSTDMYIDINELNLNAGNIVFEQDIYLEGTHPNAILFYLRDSVTTGSNVISTLVEINGDNLKIGDQTVEIECGQWNRISAVADFTNSGYDIYLNGQRVFHNMPLSGNMKQPALWRTYIGSDSPDGILYTDNMRVYEGGEPWVPEEADTIYANLQFENTQEWGLSWVKNSGNSLTWAEDRETGSGYLLLEKTNANDVCLDVNDLNLTSGHVVFEQDIYLGKNNPSGSLFYLRDSKTTGSNVVVNLVEIVQGALKIGDSRVTVSEEQWHRVSAALDFTNSRYDIYLDNIPVFEDMSMNQNLQSPSLWRIYMYSGEGGGTIGYDNLRVYDGTGPRDIDAQKPSEKDIFSDEGALAVLNGRTALQPYGKTLFYNEFRVSACVCNASRWEMDYGEGLAPDYYGAVSEYGPDYLILRLVENCPVENFCEKRFERAYEELIDGLKGEHTGVILTTGFWKHPGDGAILRVAQRRGYPCAYLGELGEQEGMRAAGRFAHTGVAAHPGDSGMREIAGKLSAILENM